MSDELLAKRINKRLTALLNPYGMAVAGQWEPFKTEASEAGPVTWDELHEAAFPGCETPCRHSQPPEGSGS